MPRLKRPDPPGYDPRYPIGPFASPATVPKEVRNDAILTLSQLPEQLRAATRGLSDRKLNAPYRDGGWTVVQLLHHIADSHTTALLRVKRMLTEDVPLVAGYDENLFAGLPDYQAPPEWSLGLLEGVHARWVMLLERLGDTAWSRTMRHSEKGLLRLDAVTVEYAWHSRHHTAHITHLRRRMGW